MHATEGAIEVRASRVDDAKVASGGGLTGGRKGVQEQSAWDDLPNSWKGS